MLRLINDAHFKFAYELYDCLLLENRTANGTQKTNWLWFIFRLQLPLFNGLLKSANCCAKKPVFTTTHRVTLAVGVGVSRRVSLPDLAPTCQYRLHHTRSRPGYRCGPLYRVHSPTQSPLYPLSTGPCHWPLGCQPAAPAVDTFARRHAR